MSIFLSKEAKLSLYPHYKKLRAEGPLHFEQALGSWLVLTHPLVREVFGDPVTFSNRYGGEATFQGIIGAIPLFFVDPPEHTRLRNLVVKAFTPRIVSRLEPRVRELAHACIDDVIDTGEMDVVKDLSAPFPIFVIAELLGIATEDWKDFLRWANAVQESVATVVTGQPQPDHKHTLQDMRRYFEDVIASRRAQPREDLISLLAHAEHEGTRLSLDEIVAFASVLLIAGTDTTTITLAQAVRSLLAHPDQLSRLRKERGLLPDAVEEALRYEPSGHMLPRMVTRDVELGPQRLKEGDRLQLVVASANRDESVFPDGERFDITRSPNPHVTLGHGIHFCVGASLARLELRASLDVVLDRLCDLERADDEPLEHGGAPHMNGLSRLRVRFRPGARQGRTATGVRGQARQPDPAVRRR